MKSNIHRTTRTAARAAFFAGGLALAGLALSWSAGTAHACTCSKPLTAAEALTGAVVVFEGVARGKATLVPGVVDPATHVPAVKQTFEVARRWKGEVPATVEVLSAERDSSCGQSYAADARYVVYIGRDDGGHLWDDSCSRTRVVAMADEDLTALGPGMPPVAGGPGASDAGAGDAGGSAAEAGGCSLGSNGRTRVEPGVLAIFTLGLGALVRRRRSRR
jgi:hypothetical protein